MVWGAMLRFRKTDAETRDLEDFGPFRRPLGQSPITFVYQGDNLFLWRYRVHRGRTSRVPIRGMRSQE